MADGAERMVAMLQVLAAVDVDDDMPLRELLASLARLCHGQPEAKRRYAVHVYLRCRDWGAA